MQNALRNSNRLAFILSCIELKHISRNFILSLSCCIFLHVNQDHLGFKKCMKRTDYEAVWLTGDNLRKSKHFSLLYEKRRKVLWNCSAEVWKTKSSLRFCQARFLQVNDTQAPETAISHYQHCHLCYWRISINYRPLTRKGNKHSLFTFNKLAQVWIM